MKTPFSALALLSLIPVASTFAETPADKIAPSAPAASESHPITGVVMAVMPERSAVLVKHEAIPGVMRAMTMLFKVNAPTLKAAREGASLTGRLVRRDGAFWLQDVVWKPAK